MKKLILSALAATMVLTSVVTAEAGQYKKRRGIDPGAAVAAGIIGLAAGAIIAGAANSGRDRYYDDNDYGGARLVGYDEYGNPIYRRYYRPRPQPYYGDYGYRSQPYYGGYPVNRYQPYAYGGRDPYGWSQPDRPRRGGDVSPEDRLRVINDRQRAYRKHCERYGCPPRY